MVYRIYAEKKPELAHEATGLATELKTFLQIEGLESIRVINRYDVEHIDPGVVCSLHDNGFFRTATGYYL